MGTSGLLGTIIRGRKKASYNHFDSYSTGLGVKVVRFNKSLTDDQIEEMARRLEEIEWVEKETTAPQELQRRYIAAGFCNMSGAAALAHILNGSLKHLIHSTNFEEDALFCEWIYYVDWEKKEIKVISQLHHGNEAKTDFVNITVAWMESLDELRSID